MLALSQLLCRPVFPELLTPASWKEAVIGMHGHFGGSGNDPPLVNKQPGLTQTPHVYEVEMGRGNVCFQVGPAPECRRCSS